MFEQRHGIKEVRLRYGRAALILAIIAALPLILMGERPLGKGLILGTLFSIANFSLMAAALPWRTHADRRKASLFSLGSIFIRYALMAAPLIWSQFSDQVSVGGVAAGLFMVQAAILGDHLLKRLRNPLEAD